MWRRWAPSAPASCSSASSCTTRPGRCRGRPCGPWPLSSTANHCCRTRTLKPPSRSVDSAGRLKHCLKEGEHLSANLCLWTKCHSGALFSLVCIPKKKHILGKRRIHTNPLCILERHTTTLLSLWTWIHFLIQFMKALLLFLFPSTCWESFQGPTWTCFLTFKHSQDGRGLANAIPVDQHVRSSLCVCLDKHLPLPWTSMSRVHSPFSVSLLLQLVLSQSSNCNWRLFVIQILCDLRIFVFLAVNSGRSKYKLHS